MGIDSFISIILVIPFAIIYFLVVAFFGFLELAKTYWYVIIVGAVLYWYFRKSIHNFLSRLWKKKIYAVLMIIVLVIAIGILFIASLDSAMTRYSNKSYSPDNKYYAQVEETNGGAMTRFNTGVVISKNSFLSNFWLINGWSGNSGGVIGLDTDLESVKVTWKDNHTLVITSSDCGQIYGKDNSWKDIKVIYHLRCTNN